MLIKMTDGGIVNYEDNCYHYDGCPTCNYGSEYINEINITLVHHAIHVKTNQMYEYAISEGQMVRLFLTEYNTIQTMTEKQFIDWFKAKLIDIAYEECIEEFEVKEVK
jgi:hypothetical protein